MNILDQIINGLSTPLTRFALLCEPVTIGMGVVAAAGAVASIAGQQSAQGAAAATEEARRIEQDNVIEENRRRASEDYINQVRLEGEQQWQEQSAVVQKIHDVKQQQLKSTATATASAAERGVTGRTVDTIMKDYAFMANEEAGRLREGQRRSDQQHAENIRAAGIEHHYRSTSVRPYVKQMQKPVDYFSPIFQAVGSTMGAYSEVRKNEGPNPSQVHIQPQAGVQQVGGLSSYSNFLVNTPQ